MARANSNSNKSNIKKKPVHKDASVTVEATKESWAFKHPILTPVIVSTIITCVTIPLSKQLESVYELLFPPPMPSIVWRGAEKNLTTTHLNEIAKIYSVYLSVKNAGNKPIIIKTIVPYLVHEGKDDLNLLTEGEMEDIPLIDVPAQTTQTIKVKFIIPQVFLNTGQASEYINVVTDVEIIGWDNRLLKARIDTLNIEKTGKELKPTGPTSIEFTHQY